VIAHEVDHPQPPTLACALAPPVEFPDTTRAANDRTRFRVLQRELMQLTVFVVSGVARGAVLSTLS
jgi:hypothetical protein